MSFKEVFPIDFNKNVWFEAASKPKHKKRRETGTTFDLEIGLTIEVCLRSMVVAWTYKIFVDSLGPLPEWQTWSIPS